MKNMNKLLKKPECKKIPEQGLLPDYAGQLEARAYNKALTDERAYQKQRVEVLVEKFNFKFKAWITIASIKNPDIIEKEFKQFIFGLVGEE